MTTSWIILIAKVCLQRFASNFLQFKIHFLLLILCEGFTLNTFVLYGNIPYYERARGFVSTALVK
jgi:hypothetical protein